METETTLALSHKEFLQTDRAMKWLDWDWAWITTYQISTQRMSPGGTDDLRWFQYMSAVGYAIDEAPKLVWCATVVGAFRSCGSSTEKTRFSAEEMGIAHGGDWISSSKSASARLCGVPHEGLKWKARSRADAAGRSISVHLPGK